MYSGRKHDFGASKSFLLYPSYFFQQNITGRIYVIYSLRVLLILFTGKGPWERVISRSQKNHYPSSFVHVLNSDLFTFTYLFVWYWCSRWHVDSMTWTDALVPCYIAVIQTLQATVVTTPQLLLFSTLLTHLYMLFTALYNHSANHYTCAHLPLLLKAAAINNFLWASCCGIVA